MSLKLNEPVDGLTRESWSKLLPLIDWGPEVKRQTKNDFDGLRT